VFDLSEYEWATTVRPEDQRALLDALNAAGEPVLDAVAARFRGPAAHGFRSYLDDHGIAYEFWSRIGD